MPEEDIPPQPQRSDDETELLTPPTSGGSFLPASSTPLREVIGDYEVTGKLGAGGMGAVYRARQISLGRMVALKILPTQFIENAESVSRFQREARVAASLSHANLVHVFAAGEAGGVHYIAMELIEGEDLGRRLKRDRRLPAPEALRICAEVARGLDHAWRTAHLIHRDIKPANIFLAENGAVKLGDLGLAKSLLGNTTGLTQTGTLMGTPHYISPEQARADRDIDFRADIYSLGCTLYHLLTGQVPYGGTEAITIIRQHLDAPLPAILKGWPQCPVPLARLVGRMLKKSRHERPASYGELLAQIESVQTLFAPAVRALEPTFPPDPDATLLATPHRATPATAPLVSSAKSPTPKSKLPFYCGIAALLIALAIGGVFFLMPRTEKLTAAQRYAQQKAADAEAEKQNPVVEPPIEQSEAKPAGADIVPSAAAETFAFAGHRYGLVRAKMTWDEARISAEKMGGHLAVIESAEEDLALKEWLAPLVTNTNVWLGASRAPEATVWMWVTAAPFGYKGWGKVDTSTGTEPLGLIYSRLRQSEAGWHRWTAWWTSPSYLVEWEEAPPSANSTPPTAEPSRPLLAKAQWEAGGKDYDFIEGMVRVRGGIAQRLATSDGAIRVRYCFRPEAKNIALRARNTPDSAYKLIIHDAGRAISLEYVGDGQRTFEKLATYTFPIPLTDGVRANLELRVIGSHLSGFFDGRKILEVQDGRVTGPGVWGILAQNGWFESAEVQEIPPATTNAAAAEPWQDMLRNPAKLLRDRATIADGRLQFPGESGSVQFPNLRRHDAAIQAHALFAGAGEDIFLRARCRRRQRLFAVSPGRPNGAFQGLGQRRQTSPFSAGFSAPDPAHAGSGIRTRNARPR